MATVLALHRPIRHLHPGPRSARAWAVALMRLWRPSPCATMSHPSMNPVLTVPALSLRARRLTRTSAMPTEHIRPLAQMRWVRCRCTSTYIWLYRDITSWCTVRPIEQHSWHSHGKSCHTGMYLSDHLLHKGLYRQEETEFELNLHSESLNLHWYYTYVILASYMSYVHNVVSDLFITNQDLLRFIITVYEMSIPCYSTWNSTLFLMLFSLNAVFQYLPGQIPLLSKIISCINTPAFCSFHLYNVCNPI